MAPDTPEREPEMQDTPPCHSSMQLPRGVSLWVFVLQKNVALRLCTRGAVIVRLE